ncbi:MAG: c-type cytochrome [Azospirillaceae bacterium]
MNKIFAAILVAGILGMATGFIADGLVTPHYPEQAAYVIDTGAGPAEVEEPEVETIPSIIPLLASADPAAGEGLTRQCTTCHNFQPGGPNGVGPNNYGVVGSQVAHNPDFNYSAATQALAEQGVEWTFENLSRFLYQPREFLPGTSMSYAGMRSAEDRANLIAWLNQQSDAPLPLPTAEEAAALEGVQVAVNETGPAEPGGAEESGAEGEGAEGESDAAAGGEAGDDGGEAEDGQSDEGSTSDEPSGDEPSGDGASGDDANAG